MATTTTIQKNNYAIILSLNERTIYVKITDQTSFLTYESNLDLKEFRLPYDLNDTFTLVQNCFNGLENHDVKMVVSCGTMKLQFNAKIGGYLKVNFEIILKEKLMSNDGQLTVNLNRIEQKQEKMIETFTKRLEELEEILEAVSHAEICLASSVSVNQHYNNSIEYTKITFKINITELTLQRPNSHYVFDFNKIKLFYKLKKITILNFSDSTISLDMFSSNTLKEMEIQNCMMRDLVGIQNFPNLEKIIFTNMQQYLTNIVSNLLPVKHNIKHIVIKNCPKVNQTELMTYCQSNNIKLEMS